MRSFRLPFSLIAFISICFLLSLPGCREKEENIKKDSLVTNMDMDIDPGPTSMDVDPRLTCPIHQEEINPEDMVKPWPWQCSHPYGIDKECFGEVMKRHSTPLTRNEERNLKLGVETEEQSGRHFLPMLCALDRKPLKEQFRVELERRRGETIRRAERFQAEGGSVQDLINAGLMPLIVNRSLDLSNKGINSLEGFDRIENLNNIQTLDLSGNQLRSLPDNFGQRMNHLHFLILQDNKLAELPVNFSRYLGGLEVLILYNNELISLPRGFSQDFRSLISLNVTKNKLTILPENFGLEMNNLRYLFLAENQLTQLPINFFRNLERLAMLSLTDNLFTEEEKKRIRQNVVGFITEFWRFITGKSRTILFL